MFLDLFSFLIDRPVLLSLAINVQKRGCQHFAITRLAPESDCLAREWGRRNQKSNPMGNLRIQSCLNGDMIPISPLGEPLRLLMLI